MTFEALLPFWPLLPIAFAVYILFLWLQRPRHLKVSRKHKDDWPTDEAVSALKESTRNPPYVPPAAHTEDGTSIPGTEFYVDPSAPGSDQTADVVLRRRPGEIPFLDDQGMRYIDPDSERGYITEGAAPDVPTDQVTRDWLRDPDHDISRNMLAVVHPDTLRLRYIKRADWLRLTAPVSNG